MIASGKVRVEGERAVFAGLAFDPDAMLVTPPLAVSS
jgi:hypothetical protein